MPENLCPQCKSPNRDSARYCAECGAPLLGGLPPSSPKPAGTSPSGAGEPNSLAGEVLLNRYRLDYVLGRGGFGAVYKGYDLNVSRPCAIKENLDVSLDAQRQFAREASVLANLSHQNLPRVTDHFSIPGQGQYLVMDYIEGEDLAALLERGKAVPYTRAAAWVIQVAEALEYMHEQEPPVLHRDIKPANIRITPRGKPYLVDFGLVKLFDPSMHTTMGARAITPGYAPPEQYGRGKTDVRTDIYALGATLYHLITGKEPLESVQRVSNDSHPLAHHVNGEIPLTISLVVAKAMALDPSQRYQSATAFRQALQNALQESEHVAPDVSRHAAFEDIAAVGVNQEAATAVSTPPKSGAQNRPVDSAVASHQAPSRPASQQRPASGPRPDAGQPPDAGQRPDSQHRPASQPLPKRRPWLTSALVIGIALACLAGALFAGSMLMRGGAASATATAAAIRTRSADVQGTADALAATVQARQDPGAASLPTPAGLPDWPVAQKTAFDAAGGDWWTGLETNSSVFDRVEAQITQGLYRFHLDSKSDNALWWVQAPTFTTGDNFVLQVDTRQTGGKPDAWRGLIFRLQDKQNFYVFSIRDSGEYSIWRYQQGQWHTIQVGSAAQAIRPGQTNQLMVLGKLASFIFYVNGQAVAEQTLPEFSSGTSGLYFEVVSPDAVSFDTDNLLLRAP